jgi:hypothetical protein
MEAALSPDSIVLKRFQKEKEPAPLLDAFWASMRSEARKDTGKEPWSEDVVDRREGDLSRSQIESDPPVESASPDSSSATPLTGSKEMMKCPCRSSAV